MTAAEEILEQIDITTHEHAVSDTDKTFTIDPFTRKIIADSGQKTILIQGDHKSEVFTFTIPRYIEGHDMAACNKIYIPYINTEVDTRNPNFKSGVYTVSNITVNKDTLVFTWEISINATSLEGVLQFMVLLSCMEGSRVEYRWNTDYYEDIIIKKSLYSELNFETEYLDVIEQWKETVKQIFKEYIDNEVDSHIAIVKAELEASMKADFEAYSDEVDDKFEQKSNAVDETLTAFDEILETEITRLDSELKTQKSRMDTFTSLEEGSTTGDAELADIRVASDGGIYDNAGNAVRDQFNNVNRAIDEISIGTVNMFDRSRVIIGYYNGSAELITTSNDYYHSHPIRVIEGVTYKWLTYSYFGASRSNVVKINDDNTVTLLNQPEVADDGTTTWTATETCYISVNLYYTYATTMMFTKADEYPEIFTPYKIIRNPNFDLDLLVTKEETEFIKNVTSDNMFDRKTIIPDVFFNVYNGSTTSSYMMSSAYIPLRGTGVYSCLIHPNFYGSNNMLQLCLFDADYNLRDTVTGVTHAELVDNLESATMYFEITTKHINRGAVYAGYSVLNSELDTAMFVKSDIYPDEYIEYINRWELDGVNIDSETLTRIYESIGVLESKLIAKTNNHLYGKTIIFDGDSICAATSETTETEDRGWAYRIGYANKMKWYNVGANGGTITAEVYTDDGTARHWISRNIDTVFEQYPDLDYYIFEGGTNDADLLYSTNQIGTIDETDFGGEYDDTTFCGAIESLIYKVLTYNPKIKIGYIVAQKMGRTHSGYGAGYNRYDYFTAAMRVCKKWGVPYVNLWDESPLNPMITSHYNTKLDIDGNKEAGSLYTDGQHLTAAGYDVISSKINEFIKSL